MLFVTFVDNSLRLATNTKTSASNKCLAALHKQIPKVVIGIFPPSSVTFTSTTMHTIKWTLLFALAAAPAFAAPPATTTATTTAVTQPTAADLEVHEWAVFVVDGATGQLNPDGLVNATVPAFVNDKRYGSASTPAPVAPVINRRRIIMINGVLQGGAPVAHAAVQTGVDMDLPSPVGVIRLIGSASSKVDVSISAKDGTFCGSYPKASDRANQLLWRDLTVLSDPPGPLSIVTPDNWFSTLRSVNSAYLSLENVGSDKFLMYDLQMPYASPLKVSEDRNFSLDVTNTSGAILHDVTLYQGDQENWRTVSIGNMAASAHPATAVASVGNDKKVRLGVSVSDVSSFLDLVKSFGFKGTKGAIVQHVDPGTPAEGKLKEGDIITRVDGKAVTATKDFIAKIAALPAGATTSIRVFRDKKYSMIQIALIGDPVPVGDSTTQPTVAATQPAVTTPKAFQLKASPTTQPAEIADTWKPRITAACVDPADAGLICRVIEQYAFDPHRLTAVYQMDDAEFDRLLPLEVVPQPAKIKRFGLVIVLNVDPSKGTAVDDLIAQMGDDDWAKRDAAYHTLASMGPAATEKLKTASHSKDLEIAWRAERLLALAGVK